MRTILANFLMCQLYNKYIILMLRHELVPQILLARYYH